MHPMLTLLFGSKTRLVGWIALSATPAAMMASAEDLAAAGYAATAGNVAAAESFQEEAAWTQAPLRPCPVGIVWCCSSVLSVAPMCFACTRQALRLCQTQVTQLQIDHCRLQSEHALLRDRVEQEATDRKAERRKWKTAHNGVVAKVNELDDFARRLGSMCPTLLEQPKRHPLKTTLTPEAAPTSQRPHLKTTLTTEPTAFSKRLKK